MFSEDRFEVYVWIADGDSDDDSHRFTAEHWFAERPGVDTLAALLEEAKQTFAILYPDAEADNYSVEIRRLRAKDLGSDSVRSPS